MSKKEQDKGGTMQLPSLKDLKGHETNPFMVELKGKMFLQPRANTIIARDQALHNKETGEILSDKVLIGKRKIVDKSEFAKIYASEIAVLYNLSKSAILVFMYLSKVMDYDNKSIFDYQKQYDKLGYKSHKQALQGIRELIAQNIIAPHIINGLWWLNPAIVCKGERFAKYTEFLTEEEAAREEKYLIAKQGEAIVHRLPESVEDKLRFAGNKKTIDENNKYHDNEFHPNQTFFNFPDDDPFTK